YNAEATAELARLCVDANPDLKRFVFMSSVGAQGPAEDDRPRPLDAEPEPVSHYGESKREAEKYLLEVSDEFDVTIFRPPPVYGPRDTDMFDVFKMARFGLAPVYGKGEGYLSLIHGADLGRAVARSVDVDHPNGSIFPIDDGEAHTWRSFTSQICEAMGKEARHICVPPFLFHAAGHVSGWLGRITGQSTIFNSDKVAEMSQPSWCCGNEKACELLDWQPRWSIEEGVEQTARWYRENGWL
ncbi:MAG: NAD-dependent epimerase/dehydratase family protein, partial [Persicimonas sp.]